MSPAPLTIDRVQVSLAPIFRRHGILKAILFGSVARGEASRRSDVDIILIQRTTDRFLNRFDPILHELNAALPGAPVEPWIYTPEEFERLRAGRFLSRAIREGRVIYESR